MRVLVQSAKETAMTTNSDLLVEGLCSDSSGGGIAVLLSNCVINLPIDKPTASSKWTDQTK